ncbi:MAG: N-acetyl sugar amidotransferase [Nitrospirae bacterium]|nr:N-acetyl sugar amidotransferase [Nitrospirota bacterium]
MEFEKITGIEERGETVIKVKSEYKICTRCIMDTTDPEIVFDENGYCNHCRWYYANVNKIVFKGDDAEKRLNQIVEEIKANRRGEYDGIIGLSGGVDSSHAIVKTVELGLKPLAVHFDSGWNSELAVKNIENLVRKLNVDLYTFVIDWEEMRDLQKSFFYASVANADVPQDHAIFAALWKIAEEKKISYIISGSNYATECILPTEWGYDSKDSKHLKAIHKKFGSLKLKKYPTMSFFKLYIYCPYIKRIKSIPILNYMPYVKKEAMKILENEFGWRYYGGKHYESVFTRFFQGYYLPAKFGYDKRKAHLSSLIVSGQMTRDEALEEMKQNYYTEEKIREDKTFILKKLGLTEEEFAKIMSLPKKTFRDYPSNYMLQTFFNRYTHLFGRFLRSIKTNLISKSS